jgi:hypothetical protein
MKKVKLLLVVIVAVSLVSGTAPSSTLQASAAGTTPNTSAATTSATTPATTPAAATLPNPPTWPRVFDRDGAHIMVYQPQMRIWQGYRVLIADTAISITQAGADKPVLGVISWKADTITDVNARTVVVRNIEVLSSRFPSLDAAHEAAMQEKVKTVYPTMTFTIGLERMIAGMEKLKEPVHAIAAETPAPAIFVSTTPAIVLLVDGKAVLAPIKGLALQYVVNTNWDVFYDKSDYYLLNGQTWLKAKELSGPWSVTAKLPPEMAKLPTDQNWGDVLKAILPVAGAQSAPKVWFTEKPAELIVFKGKPAYSAIPGTALEYATNTNANVFLNDGDKQIYVLLSGRWFREGSVDGPWSYAGNDLPMDFRRIPMGQPYSAVLVSVPGTQAADDAVLLSQVPTTAIVNRAQAEAQVKVAYAGEPKFVPIETTTMSYAANTPDKVIQVGSTYYLCFQGIWFTSGSATGPWKTADSVPQVIYTIPASSPVYNVTYVVVSNPTPTTVEMSYSSGYLGMFVLGAAVGATVVYGTGYYYPPFVYWGPMYPIYYPYPYTYGVAAVYHPYTGAYGVGGVVYGPYGAAGGAAWYNPNTGTYGRAVTTQNAYGGHTYAQAYNPYTGTYAATSQGHNQYSQWGSSVVTNGDNWAQAQHVTNSNGTAASFQTSKGSAGAGVSGKNGNSGFVAKDANNNNVYAGVDGNVYKKDSSGNWSKYDNGSWTPVDPKTGAAQTRNSTGSSSGNIGGKGGEQTPQQRNGGNTPTTNAGSAGNAGNIGGKGGEESTPRVQQGAGGRTAPTQTTPTGNRPTSSEAEPSATMGQLQNDAGSRARGDQLEQSRNAGRSGTGAAARGSRGTTTRRRP